MDVRTKDDSKFLVRPYTVTIYKYVLNWQITTG